MESMEMETRRSDGQGHGGIGWQGCFVSACVRCDARLCVMCERRLTHPYMRLYASQMSFAYVDAR